MLLGWFDYIGIVIAICIIIGAIAAYILERKTKGE